MDDKELERLAQEELLAEAKRGRVRAETMGMLGWQKSPVPRTNKRFLTNILMSTIEPKRKKPKPTDSNEDSQKSHKMSENTSNSDKDNKAFSELRKGKHDCEQLIPRKTKHNKKYKSKRKDS